MLNVCSALPWCSGRAYRGNSVHHSARHSHRIWTLALCQHPRWCLCTACCTSAAQWNSWAISMSWARLRATSAIGEEVLSWTQAVNMGQQLGIVNKGQHSTGSHCQQGSTAGHCRQGSTGSHCQQGSTDRHCQQGSTARPCQQGSTLNR